MNREAAIEAARSIIPAHYMTWIYHEGMIYQTCCDCGLSHLIILDEGRARFLPEDELTEAARENDTLTKPLYTELKQLREWNVNARRLLEEAQRIAESDLMAVGHARDSEARTLAMQGLREWIKKLEMHLT
jgi:hypothetical protein